MSARTRTLALGLCVLVVVALAGAEVAVQRMRLFEHYLLLSDDTSYSLMDVHRARLVERQGRIRTAIEELRTNNRHPLRTIPLIVLAPELLTSKVGHLATSLPLLAIFLWALAWTVWERTRSVPYALSAVLLFAQLRGVYDLHLGLGTYLLDLPASFAVMAAILALLRSDGGKRLGWLVASYLSGNPMVATPA